MAVVTSLAALAPPSTASLARPHQQLPVDKESIALAEALDSIAKTQPVLFARLHLALHAKLDAELRHIVRVRPDLILVSQGRAQVADDLLAALDNCDAIARTQRQRQQTSSPALKG